MIMKSYSAKIPENCACARVEGVNASYKDLAEVCGRIRNKKSAWAVSFLEKVSEGKAAVLYRTYNKRLGHRKELKGRKGRWPKKAASIVLKTLLSAIANGKVKGLGDEYTVLVASANKKDVYPRLASKGRWSRSNLETARVEIVLQGSEIPKGVEVTPPKKKEVKKEEKPKKEAKKPEPKKEAKKPEAKKEEKKEERPPPQILKEEAKEHHTHKHEAEKTHEQEKKKKEMPHQHGEHDKR